MIFVTFVTTSILFTASLFLFYYPFHSIISVFLILFCDWKIRRNALLASVLSKFNIFDANDFATQQPCAVDLAKNLIQFCCALIFISVFVALLISISVFAALWSQSLFLLHFDLNLCFGCTFDLNLCFGCTSDLNLSLDCLKIWLILRYRFELPAAKLPVIHRSNYA